MISAFIIAAQSQDGFIARSDGELSTTWTSPEDKKRFVELTKRARVLVMGRKTFATIGRGLPERHIMVYTRTPKESLIQGVEETALPPHELLKELEGRGYTEVAICGGREVYTLFLEAKAVNRIYLTTEPVVFGTGIRFIDKPLRTPLNLVSETKMENSGVVFAEYSLEI